MKPPIMITGAVLILAALCLAGSPAEAGQYFGDLCWLVTPVPSSATGILKLSFYYPGGLHLLATGKMVMGPAKFPMTAYLTLDEDSFIGQLITSAFNADLIVNQTALIVLDTATLNGQYMTFIEAAAIQPPDVQNTFSQGYLTVVTCPAGL